MFRTIALLLCLSLHALPAYALLQFEPGEGHAGPAPLDGPAQTQ